MPSSKTSTESMAGRKAERLKRTIAVSSWWLMGQGILQLVVGPTSSIHLNLRYQFQMSPYIDQAGWALVGLGFFVHRAVREANRQYLAVDSLLLFFCGMAWSTFHFKLLGGSPFPFEWFALLMNLGLVTALIVNRTNSRAMENSGTLVTQDAELLAKTAWSALQDRLSQAKPTPPPLVQAPPTPEARAEAPAATAAPPPPADETPKAKSIALPHLD